MKSNKNIRPLEKRDRARIREMVIDAGNFNALEIETALELIDEALEEGEQSGYIVAVYSEGEAKTAGGYVCYGPVPLTDGVYDLYWIVVDPALQGKGIGRILIRYVEKDVLDRGGRMILIETSSLETYGATIRFYEKSGYFLAARIKNFYRIGDDKLVFQKDLS